MHHLVTLAWLLSVFRANVVRRRGRAPLVLHRPLAMLSSCVNSSCVNNAAGLLSAGIYPILKGLDLHSLAAPNLSVESTLPLQPVPALTITTPTRSWPSSQAHAGITEFPPPSLQLSSSAAYAPSDAPSAGPDRPAPTLLSSAIRLGTVFSPTDNLAILHYLSPNTQPVLHSVLFGEGVMNDISAVVMLMTTTELDTVTPLRLAATYWRFLTMFVSSSLLGVAAGLLSALLTKRAHPPTRSPVPAP